MGRRRRGRALHGWIVLDKPLGMSSTQALSRVQRALDAKKAGHAGALDPLASGVLPLAFGEATKLVPYLMSARKTYRFTLRWGAETTTDDLEGEITQTSGLHPDRAAIEAAIPAFLGDIEQAPPAYSAIKVNGERAYALARAGKAPEMAARTVTAHALSLLDHRGAESDFELLCGKGFYVRSLARDLARACGSRGHVTALRRTAVGPMTLDHAISLDDAGVIDDKAASAALLRPLSTALDDIPALAVGGPAADRLRRGQTAALGPEDRSDSFDPPHASSRRDEAGRPLVFVEDASGPVAMTALAWEGDELTLRPIRVFTL